MRCDCDHCIARDRAMGRSTAGRNIGRPPLAAKYLADARKGREELAKLAEILKRLTYHVAYGVALKEEAFDFDNLLEARRFIAERIARVDGNITRWERIAR